MIYLDNHATTRCDPRVVEAMLPWFSDHFGNPHSGGHEIGRLAGNAIEQAISELAGLIHAPPDSILITSGATESNNLAIRGVCTHPRQKRRHIVTVTTEHHAVLDVCAELQRDGFRLTHVPVAQTGDPNAGIVDLNQLAEVVDEDTALVSVMWANNEIGAIAPMKAVAEICHAKGALLHSDATQAVGRIPVDVVAADIDLISATAHKFYGPKGAGLLTVGNGARRVRLKPQIVGGGQQHNLRSGTVSPPAVIGLTTALRLCVEEMDQTRARTRRLRDLLFQNLSGQITGIRINGPDLDGPDRLPGNLNMVLPAIEGSAWIAATPEVAFSSGSACSSTEPKPSHVLTAIGLTESEARRCVRFGIGRYTTEAEIASASKLLLDSYRELSLIGT